MTNEHTPGFYILEMTRAKNATNEIIARRTQTQKSATYYSQLLLALRRIDTTGIISLLCGIKEIKHRSHAMCRFRHELFLTYQDYFNARDILRNTRRQR